MEVRPDTLMVVSDDLRSRPKCVLLNSRQSKRPCGRDPWLQATMRAVEGLIRREYLFVTSVGINIWEVVLHLVNALGGNQILVLPTLGDSDAQARVTEIYADFKLDPRRCSILPLAEGEAKGTGDKSWWRARDRMVTDLADVLVPISLRRGGNLEQLVAEGEAAGKTVIDDFQVKYHPAIDRVRYDFPPSQINPIFLQPGWCHLTHWTRSSHHPYPGETSHDFYGDIVNSESYPRSAFHTLLRIAGDGIVRGSSRFIRGGHRVVSFSALNPVDAVGLMRWRRRYVYYNFEPYGVAIDAEVAHAVGFKPAIYGEAALFDRLSDREKPYYQNSGSKVADWTPEAEWRYLGDLRLSDLPANKIKLICYTGAEAQCLRSSVPYQAIPFIVG